MEAVVSSRPRRLRPRLSLRVLMLLVLVAGVWMGGLVNRARRQRETVEAVKRHGGWVHYDWEFLNGKLSRRARPRAPLWLREVLGDEHFQEVIQANLSFDDVHGRLAKGPMPASEVLTILASFPHLKILHLRQTEITDAVLERLTDQRSLEALHLGQATEVTDHGFAHLSKISSLKQLNISNSRVTERGLGRLANLPGLERLQISGERIGDAELPVLSRLKPLKDLSLAFSERRTTDRAMVHFRAMNGLKRLDLSWTAVTDRGLEHLKELENLESLSLVGTAVTDAGLEHLKGMEKLESLYLTETAVTDLGLEQLKEMRRLRSLLLHNTKTTKAGKTLLKAALPKLTIRGGGESAMEAEAKRFFIFQK